MTGVRGHCPACGEESLFLDDGGHVTCSRLRCPRPTAVDELLAASEPQHIVTVEWEGFSMVHPMIERLDDLIANCELHRHLVDTGIWPERGRYRVGRSADGWAFERLDS